MHGVNYGNRFVPEDWMLHPYNFFKSLRKHKTINRVALWDLAGCSRVRTPPRQRMLNWLDATIHESHFAEMKRLGVNVVRVPCGYWNWVTYNGDDGPEAPADLGGVPVAERLKNLHRIAKPHEYRVYFDRIFDYASKHGIKVLLDLHGCPGSQNGEIHSGACIEMGENRSSFFDTEANKAMAVEAVRAMASYGKHRTDSLFGIQVINEPHLQAKDGGHSFLRDYYERAIAAAREHLDEEVPVVLFEWTYNMEKWEEDAFPEAKYGAILWDTHIYHFPEEDDVWTTKEGGLEKAMKAYRWDLSQVRYFSSMQGGRVFVGEYSLAGPSLQKPECRELAQWLVDQIDFAAAGSLLWTFDCAYAAWSMQRQALDWGIDWRRLTDARRHDSVEGHPISLKAAHGDPSLWLSAHEDGSVRVVSQEADFWEEWVPYRYKVAGELRVALRSSAHGTWLSVSEHGKVTQADTRSLWEEFSVVPIEVAGDRARGRRRQQVALLSAHGTWVSTCQDLRAVLAEPFGDLATTPEAARCGAVAKARRTSANARWIVA